jgi:GTP cyclohydrolase II
MTMTVPSLHARELSRAKLPTRSGDFDVVAFDFGADSFEPEHVALVRGLPAGAVVSQEPLPVRIHSECLTGDAFGSLRCDCRDQLELALQELARLPQGILLYLRQEGRGIGLANKVRAYALQEQGLDTVEANLHLGFPDDLRDYGVAAAMLRALGVSTVTLLTNNPRKVFGLKQHGITVAGRRSLSALANPHNHRYLATKASKSGHLF